MDGTDRTPKSRMSIRGRLVALVLVAALPVFLLYLWDELASRQQRAAEIREQILQAAQLIAAEQEQYFRTARTVLVSYLESPVVQSGEPVACGDYLSRLARRFPQYTGLGVANSAGRIICTTNPRQLGLDVSGRDYFREVIANKSFAIGDVSRGAVSGRRIVGAAYPALDETGRVELVGIVGLDLERWSEAIPVSSLPPGASVVVVDAASTIMARAPAGSDWISRPAPEDLASAARAVNGAAREIEDTDGVRRAYVFAPLVEGESVSIGVGVPVAPLFAEIDRRFWQALAALGGLFVLLAFLAWIGSDMAIRRPIGSLLAAIERIRAGDFTARGMTATQIPELVRLEQSFNAMAESLERHEAELISANADLTQALRGRELLLGELNHRVKNTLATVQSIAAQTARNTPSTREFTDRFQARLMALSRTHDLLTTTNWESARLSLIFERELSPYLGTGMRRVSMKGDPTDLDARSGLAIGLVVHELATNAAKYGALASPGGRLEISWTREERGSGPWVQLLWREFGGPPVVAPVRQGFGSRLIERSITTELGGRLDMEYAPDGLRCRIEFPLNAPGLHRAESRGTSEDLEETIG